jgi:hypothetical protein
MTHFRVLLANIVGVPGGWSVPVVAVPGKPVNPGLFESGLAGLADGFTSSFVFVVGGDVADAGVEADPVVVRRGDLAPKPCVKDSCRGAWGTKRYSWRTLDFVIVRSSAGRQTES